MKLATKTWQRENRQRQYRRIGISTKSSYEKKEEVWVLGFGRCMDWPDTMVRQHYLYQSAKTVEIGAILNEFLSNFAEPQLHQYRELEVDFCI